MFVVWTVCPSLAKGHLSLKDMFHFQDVKVLLTENPQTTVHKITVSCRLPLFGLPAGGYSPSAGKQKKEEETEFIQPMRVPIQKPLLEGNLLGAWAQNLSSRTCLFASSLSHLTPLRCRSTAFHYLISFCLQDQAYFMSVYYFSAWSVLKMNLFTNSMWAQENVSVQNCNSALWKFQMFLHLHKECYLFSFLPLSTFPSLLSSIQLQIALLNRLQKYTIKSVFLIIYPPEKIKTLFILFSFCLCLFNISINCGIHWVHKHYEVWNAKWEHRHSH